MRSGRDVNNYAIQLHYFSLITGRAITNHWVCELGICKQTRCKNSVSQNVGVFYLTNVVCLFDKCSLVWIVHSTSYLQKKSSRIFCKTIKFA